MDSKSLLRINTQRGASETIYVSHWLPTITCDGDDHLRKNTRLKRSWKSVLRMHPTCKLIVCIDIDFSLSTQGFLSSWIKWWRSPRISIHPSIHPHQDPYLPPPKEWRCQFRFPLTQLLHFHVKSCIIQTRTSRFAIPSKTNHLQILTPLDTSVPTREYSVYGVYERLHNNQEHTRTSTVAKNDATLLVSECFEKCLHRTS